MLGGGSFRWWHAVVIFVVANGVNALAAGYNGDEGYYESLRRPGVAPPAWAFAPVWVALNVTSLAALYLVANAPERTPRRRAALAAEGVGWALYCVFSWLFFALRSPVLGASVTAAYLVVTVVAMAGSAGVSRAAVWLLSPRLLWLLLATYVSATIAANNPDAVFGIAR